MPSGEIGRLQLQHTANRKAVICGELDQLGLVHIQNKYLVVGLRTPTEAGSSTISRCEAMMQTKPFALDPIHFDRIKTMCDSSHLLGTIVGEDRSVPVHCVAAARKCVS